MKINTIEAIFRIGLMVALIAFAINISNTRQAETKNHL